MEKLELSPHMIMVESTKDQVYAYNSILGGLKKLSEQELELINKIKSNEIIDEKKYKNQIDLLKKLYFLKNMDDEYETIKPVLEKYQRDVSSGDSITKLLLYVTGNCMLRCTYCYINDAHEMEKNPTGLNCGMGKMSWDVAKKSIDVFKEIIDKNKQKKIHIRFHGGEPFLNFEVIKKTILYVNEVFKDTEVVFHTNTNGVCVTDEMIDFLIHEGNKGNHSFDLEVSIDGPKDCHDKLRKFSDGRGSFDYGINTIKRFIDKGFPIDQIDCAATLNKYNYTRIRELIDLAKEIGLKNVEINTLIFESDLDLLDKVDDRVDCLIDARIYGVKQGIHLTGKWFKLLERLYNPVLNYCGRIGQQFAVDLDGNVFLCTGYFRNFGKIEDWEKIIQDETYINLASRIVGQIKECRDCPIECLCAGGCPASAESSYGSFYKKEAKECEFRKRMVENLIKNIDKVCDEKVKIDEIDPSYNPTIAKYKEEL